MECRIFLKSAAAVSSMMILKPGAVFGTRANSAVQIGIIGCIFLSSLHDADANKEKAFISSIESGNYLNETRSGSESTLTAILGRQAAEQGKRVTWEEMSFSNEKIDHHLNLSQFDKH